MLAMLTIASLRASMRLPVHCCFSSTCPAPTRSSVNMCCPKVLCKLQSAAQCECHTNTHKSQPVIQRKQGEKGRDGQFRVNVEGLQMVISEINQATYFLKYVRLAGLRRTNRSDDSFILLRLHLLHQPQEPHKLRAAAVLRSQAAEAPLQEWPGRGSWPREQG